MKNMTLHPVALCVTLVLVLASLWAVPPVVAGQEMACHHDEATVESLRACVDHAAEMGHIHNQGVANSLLAKLYAAQDALNRGQPGVAVANLQAFIHEVEAQSGKQIGTEHAAHMVMHANDVIAALNQQR